MIHEILPSDIETAKGMLESRTDAEVLAALVSRGIDPPKAAQLMDDLRHGRAPGAQLPFSPRPVVAPRPAVVPTPALDPPRAHYKHRYSASAFPWWMVLLLLTFLLALGYALFQTSESTTVHEDRHEIPPPPNKDR